MRAVRRAKEGRASVAASETAWGAMDHSVRVSLAVGRSVNGAAPGVAIEDCGRCTFCLDKPKFGGPGTKRQKCILKRTLVGGGPIRVWSTLRVVSQARTRTVAPSQHCEHSNTPHPLLVAGVPAQAEAV